MDNFLLGFSLKRLKPLQEGAKVRLGCGGDFVRAPEQHEASDCGSATFAWAVAEHASERPTETSRFGEAKPLGDGRYWCKCRVRQELVGLKEALATNILHNTAVRLQQPIEIGTGHADSATPELAAKELGLWFGRRHGRNNVQQEGMGIVGGGMMLLLALVLAVTLSFANGRFEERRTAVFHEADAIGRPICAQW